MPFFGPDGARYQEGIRLADADWDLISFGVWRAIHQTGRPDATYAPMRDQFAAHNKPFAAYVWVDGTPPELKADLTVKAVADPTIPIMVDWEDEQCSFQRMLQYVEAMRARGYRVPLLYTGRAFWQTMGAPTLTDYGLELVVARYGNQSDTGQYECESRYLAMLPRFGVWSWNLGGLTPVMWQFASRVRWGDKYMDMNAILDRAVIERGFKDWTPVPPPPDPDPPAPPVPVPSRRLEGTSIPMAALASKETGSPTWWYSPNGGATRVACRDQAHAANVVKAFGSLIDGATGAEVTSWAQVQSMSASEVARVLGPTG